MPDVFGTYSDKFCEESRGNSSGIGEAHTHGGPIIDSLHLGRHDNHNLELKTTFRGDKRLNRRLDVYLFFPSSLHLRTWTKLDLMSDFHPRLRIALLPGARDGFHAIVRELAQLKHLIDFYEVDTRDHEILRLRHAEKVLISCKHLGALFSEAIKTEGAATKAASSCDCGSIKKSVDTVIFHVNLARETLTSRGAREFEITGLLDQFLSHSFVEFIGGVRDIAEPASDQTLLSYIDDIQRRESRIHADRGYLTHLRDETDREDYLIHMGQLKKFFQSETFIDINQKAAAKKFTEPIAAVAAGFAAFVTTFVERNKDVHWVGIGYRGIFVLWLGIFAYVMKDRLKDVVRNYFNKKISGKVLPDWQRVLMADGKILGKARDWYSILKSKQLLPEIKEMRQSSLLNAAEKHLHEDILHYRRDFSVYLDRFRSSSEPPGLNEILRINMERYLKHMDDPDRIVRGFDQDGRLVSVKSRKVYQIYAVIVAKKTARRWGLRLRKFQDEIDDYHLFRIIADKSGIARVETVRISNV